MQTHTHIQMFAQKQIQETRCILAKGWHVAGLKTINLLSANMIKITVLVASVVHNAHTNMHTYRCLHRNNFKKQGAACLI